MPPAAPSGGLGIVAKDMYTYPQNPVQNPVQNSVQNQIQNPVQNPVQNHVEFRS